VKEKSARWKGGRQKTTQGYILIYCPEHPFPTKPKYVKEERLVAEKCLKRYLTREEVIHHINEIRDDNRLENLYLFPSNSEHSRFTATKNKIILTSNIICIQFPN